LEKLSVFDLLRSIFGHIWIAGNEIMKKSYYYDFASFIVGNKLVNKET